MTIDLKHLKYVRTSINNINGFKQSTRAKNVGQLSDMVQDYDNNRTKPRSVEGWKEYYEEKRPGCIDVAANTNWEGIQELIENLKKLTKEQVREWTEDLVIDNTYSGLLKNQQKVLEMVSVDGDFRVATPEEESKGIDGFVNGEFVSVKPVTYKQTINSKKENINVPIIYYKKGNNKGDIEIV